MVQEGSGEGRYPLCSGELDRPFEGSPAADSLMLHSTLFAETFPESLSIS